jgi:hypothetical protein
MAEVEAELSTTAIDESVAHVDFSIHCVFWQSTKRLKSHGQCDAPNSGREY